MKKALLILSAFIFQHSFGQYQFVLEGRVQDPAQKKIYLEIRDNYSLNEFVKLDSCVVVNGSFKFSGQLTKKSEMAKLLFLHDKTKFKNDDFRFVLDSGKNFININTPKPGSESAFSNAVRPVSVSNDIYNQQNILYEEYFNKYAEDVKSWDNNKPEEITMIRLLQNREKTFELREKQLEIVKKYPDSFYSLIFLYESFHNDPYYRNPLPLIEIFKNLNPSLQNDLLGIEFYKETNDFLKAKTETSVARQVPVFQIKTDKGENFTNSSLSGKPYMIAFSATWCTPCKQMEPQIKALYDAYKDKSLEVVYFNFDDNDKKWKNHIAANKLNWINVCDGLKAGKSPIIKQFNITSIPVYMIVDKKGNIIYNSNTAPDREYATMEKYIVQAVQ